MVKSLVFNGKEDLDFPLFMIYQRLRKVHLCEGALWGWDYRALAPFLAR